MAGQSKNTILEKYVDKDVDDLIQRREEIKKKISDLKSELMRVENNIKQKILNLKDVWIGIPFHNETIIYFLIDHITGEYEFGCHRYRIHYKKYIKKEKDSTTLSEHSSNSLAPIEPESLKILKKKR